jgi:hypothetical protein
MEGTPIVPHASTPVCPRSLENATIATWRRTKLATIRGPFIRLLVARRLVYATFPKFLPSSAWPQSSWLAGVLINAAFELILLMFLLGVPFCIYFFKLRTGHTNARDLLIDCAATVSLYLAALFLL